MKCLNCGERIFEGNYCDVCEGYMLLRKEAMKKQNNIDEVNVIDRALSIRKEMVETRGKLRIRFAQPDNNPERFDFFNFMCELTRKRYGEKR
ncbi:MAG: hypothetical protein QXO70_04100 [Candidatus Pacearchaeota archaeon]